MNMFTYERKLVAEFFGCCRMTARVVIILCIYHFWSSG